MKTKRWDATSVKAAYSFYVNPDSCSNPDFFQSFIRFSAVTDQKSGRGVTHALLSDDEETLFGFITLKNTALLTSDKHGGPALEIVNLAVSKDFERRGVGRQLVYSAIGIAETCNELLSGVRFLILAADPKSVGFYRHMGFHEFDNYWKLPRETTNENCVPMFMQLYN